MSSECQIIEGGIGDFKVVGDGTDLFFTLNHPDIVLYSDFIESPIEGELPVYEELFLLTTDPNELLNLVDDIQYKGQLELMQKVWESQIKFAQRILTSNGIFKIAIYSPRP